jgi:MauM/NapG family ferredoxin protein
MDPLSSRGDRRGFLRAGFDGWLKKVVDQTTERVAPRRYFRPPGAMPELGFVAACSRCGECASACPSHAIRLAPTDAGLAAGTPYIDPRLQPCTVCADMPCVQACPTDALTVPPTGWNEIRLGELEFFPERCVTFQGVTCGVCAGVCPVGERALTMDEAGHPVLRREGCVGCGLCVRACITAPSSFELHHADR